MQIILIFLFMSLILLSSILTLKKSGFKFKRVQSIGYLIIVLTLLTAILQNDYLELVNRIVFVLFYILAAINLLVGIVKSKEVDSNVIFSAVAVYLLFGFCGALLVAVIHFFNPACIFISKHLLKSVSPVLIFQLCNIYHYRIW